MRRLLRKLIDRIAGRDEEGPDPPARIREEAELQLLRARTWGPEDWAAYAAELAEVSYRDGYLRGFTNATNPPNERRLELGERPEEERRNWSLFAAVSERPFMGHYPTSAEIARMRGDPGDPLAGMSAEAAKEFVRRLAEHGGTYDASGAMIYRGHDAARFRVREEGEDDDEGEG